MSHLETFFFFVFLSNFQIYLQLTLNSYDESYRFNQLVGQVIYGGTLLNFPLYFPLSLLHPQLTAMPPTTLLLALACKAMPLAVKMACSNKVFASCSLLLT